jgi:Protein of unknown function (DUF2442)
MSTATLTEPRIVSVTVTDEAIVARLADGRAISVPLKWSWRLKDASPEQRGHWEIIGDGQGVHWPDVDEDISVEGMLRGVPAKRPSRTEVRILLDASSLIDAEHGKPVSFTELEKLLRRHHARLILTYTNVLEFVGGPFERTGDRLALRDRLQQLERLPIGYIRERGIMLAELKEAIAAFKEKRECALIDPYGRRWDETVRPQGPSPMQILVKQSLYDCVSSVLRAAGNVSPLTLSRRLYDDALREQFQNDRELPLKVRSAAGEHFRKTIRAHLAQSSIDFPSERLDELADWIYANPATRCPGYRLAWEVRRELMNNITEKVSGNDMLDNGSVLATPYVDAVTMDRGAADRCLRVTGRLKARNPAINYEERIFTNLKDLLDSKL